MTGSSPTPLTPLTQPADEIAARVLAVPGVVRLHPGRFGEVATYLPGRRVAGVKLGQDEVEVHVVLSFDSPIRAVAQQIHAAVAALVAVPVLVFVEDLAAPSAA
ncbi:Asp23/Gls24 family envelope stress response protein [Kineococcus sp. SYSU DK003]|uniref:Asp23/Gls24 family envelope stress response protein n=1 Tax=Kineococcus sp. SYSU DK003 TaxID=3383124 RepID=UPI003D7CF42C